MTPKDLNIKFVLFCVFIIGLCIGTIIQNDVYAQSNVFDSGILTLSDSSSDVTTNDLWIRTIRCVNTTGSAATLTIEDGNDVDYYTAVSVAANSVVHEAFNDPGLKMAGGLSWVSGTASALNCQVMGRSVN